MKHAQIVDLMYFTLHESGRDMSHSNSRARQLSVQRFGERAHREFAHTVGRGFRPRNETRDASHQHEIATRSLERGKRCLDRPEHAKHIGFELAAEIYGARPVEMVA